MIESLFLLKNPDNIFLSGNLEFLRNYVIINCQKKALKIKFAFKVERI